jgi:hypothetical protein
MVAFIVGQACALALIDVRPYAVFQHYYPWTWIAGGHTAAIWGVVLQASVVCALAIRQRAYIRRSLAGIWSWRAAVVVGLIGFSLVVPAESVSRVAGELLLAGALALIAALNLVLIGLLLPAQTLSAAADWVNARMTLGPLTPDRAPKRWDRLVPVIVAIWVVVLSALVNDRIFERLPHIDDSISNYFQAKYFAAGHLYLPAPPDAPSFQVDQTVVDSGKWYGYAFPGWPAVLAVAVRMGAAWLANPLLGGVLILIGHALVRRRSGVGTANAVVLLLACSPWLIYTSAEFMVHPLSGVLALTVALAFDHASDRGPRWPLWAALAGAAAGALVLTRAIDSAVVAAAVALTVAVDRRFTQALPAGFVTGAVACLVAVVVLPYNRALTGRPLYFPHMAWSDSHWGPGVDRMGFGRDVGIRAWPNLDPLPGHGPADVVLNTNKNLFMANVDLFGWAMGSLVLIALALALGRWQRSDSAMLLIPLAFLVGYNFYWFSGGPDFGPRYWYPVLVPLAALSVRGAEAVSHALGNRATIAIPGARVAAALAIASLSAAVTVLPWRGVTKYRGYRDITGEVRTLADARGFAHALVFVRSNARDYQSAFNLNPATLDDPATIYALDAGPEHRAAVVARFPDRPVWVIARAQDHVLKVTAGPLWPGTVP